MPKRPFRDSAIFYGALSCAIVLFGWLTGRQLLPSTAGSKLEPGALGIAAGFFVIATGYTWWRFRQQIARGEGRK